MGPPTAELELEAPSEEAGFEEALSAFAKLAARRTDPRRPAKSRSKGLAKEAPFAYKDVDRVVEIVERAALSRRVAQLRPIGVIKD